MPFETLFGPGNPFFDGEFSSFHHELPGVGVPPSNVIRTDQEWHVHIEWKTTGVLNPMIGGNWHIHCYLESLGPGPDVDIQDENADAHVVPLTPAGGDIFYNAVFNVKQNVINLPPGTPMLQTGLYRLVVALTYIDLANTPGPIAAFQEGPVLQFYNPD